MPDSLFSKKLRYNLLRERKQTALRFLMRQDDVEMGEIALLESLGEEESLRLVDPSVTRIFN